MKKKKKKKKMKKKKVKKYFFFFFFFSKTTVNPLRKQNPYQANKTPIRQTDLTGKPS